MVRKQGLRSSISNARSVGTISLEKNQDKFKRISDRHSAPQALVTSPGLKHFSTQVCPGNLVLDKEWEADYYDLKRSSTSSSATSLSTLQKAMEGGRKQEHEGDSDNDEA
jgi:hypothetical protein